VYIHEGGDENGDITVSVDHHDYEAEANYDANHDGRDDTAMVETDDGYIGFTDTDGDGHADLMTTFDDHGDVTSQAKFDSANGEWVSVDPHGGADQTDAAHHDASEIRVDTPDGEKDIGPATEDTDGDGRPDTAVVKTDDGGMVLYTDRDGDGEADQATQVDKDGNVTVSVHHGKGDWEVVQKGHLDSDGHYVPDGGSSVSGAGSADGYSEWDSSEDSASSAAGGSFHIDPTTGQWVTAS
jgi:Family of unknown function (DUF6802)